MDPVYCPVCGKDMEILKDGGGTSYRCNRCWWHKARGYRSVTKTLIENDLDAKDIAEYRLNYIKDCHRELRQYKSECKGLNGEIKSLQEDNSALQKQLDSMARLNLNDYDGTMELTVNGRKISFVNEQDYEELEKERGEYKASSVKLADQNVQLIALLTESEKRKSAAESIIEYQDEIVKHYKTLWEEARGGAQVTPAGFRKIPIIKDLGDKTVNEFLKSSSDTRGAELEIDDAALPGAARTETTPSENKEQ